MQNKIKNYIKTINIKPKTVALNLAFDMAGGFFYAIGIYTFAKAAQFAMGGVGGITLILNHLFPILPIGTTALVLNLPIIALCYRIVGRKFMLRSFISMAITTFFTDIVAPLIPEYTGDKLLASIFGGVFLGIGLALIYARDSSTGGSDFVIMSVKKLQPHMSLGQIILISDCVVISLGGLAFGNIDSVLYGAIASFASTVVIDKIMYGTGGGKMVIVITQKGFELAKNIDDEIERGSTIVKSIGGYTKEEKHMVICVASRHQVFKVRNIAHKIDPLSFVTITDATEIFGEGFTPHI